jgi:enamine deaminase RidA (YjgF/YER057c/UK114 family)
MSIEENLKKLNIKIPDAPSPVGAYVAFKIINKLVFISGQLPIDSNGKMIKGTIGKELSLEDGQKASKLCIINILSQIKKAVNGDLEKVKNCVKITGFVNSADDFTDQPKVINPASETLSAVFGDKGMHARVAVSVNSLPLGVAVEIDAIFEIN